MKSKSICWAFHLKINSNFDQTTIFLYQLGVVNIKNPGFWPSYFSKSLAWHDNSRSKHENYFIFVNPVLLWIVFILVSLENIWNHRHVRNNLQIWLQIYFKSRQNSLFLQAVFPLNPPPHDLAIGSSFSNKEKGGGGWLICVCTK